MIGVQLLTNEAALRADPKESDSFDTLKCVTAACEAAIDVLNDILCFDKMESRSLDLRRQSTAVLPFLSDCLNMFAPVAAAKNIDLRGSFYHGDDPNTPSLRGSISEITTEDFIEIDVFKMQQVIRNILSNALKFTPQNGHIVFRAWISHQNDHIFSPLQRKKTMQRSLSADIELDGNLNVSDIELGKSAQALELPTLNIMIKDSGAGFDKEHQDKVFNEVFQYKPEVLQGGGGR